MTPGFLNFLGQPAVLVAPRLLGCLLEREVDGQRLQVRIVETEAYDQSDVASHSYKGMTPRTQVMFGPPGHLYVYFTYGMHYCCNVVTGPPGHGAAVLLRAVEPLVGAEVMAATNGPAKLCRVLGIDRSLNGHSLASPPLRLVEQPALPPASIVQTTRIGISRGKAVPWRFYVRGSRYISRP
jgi:DNA-3-methyladenine glycosylase